MIFFRQLSPDFTKTLLGIISILMALAIAIPFHEFAHAFAAKKRGDYTAVAYKRCTPAALVHFDFIGFFMMMFFGYGWAKPVPVNSNNFKMEEKVSFGFQLLEFWWTWRWELFSCLSICWFSKSTVHFTLVQIMVICFIHSCIFRFKWILV